VHSLYERFLLKEQYQSNVRDLVREPFLEPRHRHRANVSGAAVGNGNGDKDGKSKLSSINLKMGNLSIVDTSRTAITLQAHVNFTNPTNYSATVPYFSINILVNDTILGQGTAKDVNVHPGNNTNILVTVVWDPFTNSGDDGKAVGREMLSQYVSGKHAFFTISNMQFTDNTRLQYNANTSNS
jgi:hypothetical protein